jgi:ribosome-associated translation inhibitor RaiA
MTRPLQVTFRNMAVAPSLEEEVRARAAWLETFYTQIVGCRVLIEFPHRHQTRGRPIHIRVELSVPGEDIVVNQETTRHFTFGDALSEVAHKALAGHPDHRDVVVAIHDAFDAARRRLEDFARRQRADVKTSRADAASVP